MQTITTVASSINGNQVLNAADTTMVCIMGVGVVFVVLLCTIFICSLMSWFFKNQHTNANAEKNAQTAVQPATAQPVFQQTAVPQNNEFIAAISAAIAEDSGTDINAIKIISIKKI